MSVPDRSRHHDIGAETTRIDTRALAIPIGAGVAARMTRLQGDIATWVGDAAWSVLHVVGAHRWRDGYETDPERGMSRYRGSRCTICDSPWEGW